MNKFGVGDKVTWSSQAGGSVKVKVGVVEVILQPGRMPTSLQISGCGNPRNHESYLVLVPNKSGRGVGKKYWPLVSKLRYVP